MINDSEAKINKILESLRDTCQIIGFDWSYVYANDTTLRKNRFTKDTLQKLTIMDVYPGLESTDLFQRMRETMEKRVFHQFEYEYLLPNGTPGCFKIHIEPVNEGILIHTIDNTVSKRLESTFDIYQERLEKVIAERTSKLIQANLKLEQMVKDYKKVSGALNLRAIILEKVTEAILLFDLNGNFIYVNSAACKMYGFPQEELIRMNLQQLVLEPEVPDMVHKLKLLLKRGELNTEMVHMRKDRSLIPVRLYSSVVALPAGRCVISAVRDISREKQMEDAIRRCEIQLTLHRV